MKGTIEELWYGNIIPHEDSRTNSKEMKELLGYIARHHEDLEKSFTDEQKEIFEKFHDTIWKLIHLHHNPKWWFCQYGGGHKKKKKPSAASSFPR